VKKLSVVINTLNEARELEILIKSFKNLADEIVVCDMESKDGTPEIARKLGAKVFTHRRIDYVEPARNFAISKATGDWVLVLDVDEEIPLTLVNKIKELIEDENIDYYRIPRKNIIFGKWIEHTLWWPDYQIRLFKKGKVSWNEIIHSVPLTTGQGHDLESKESLSILHHNYDFVDQYIDKLNRYSTVQSELLVKENYKFDWRDLISKPFKEFVSRYFRGEGYKDGLHGLALSLLQSFSELVLYLKVWQLSNFKQEDVDVSDLIKETSLYEKDLHFWQNDALYKETGDLAARIKRKLRI
jgi:(heptosyl)LPS beta-1,4-glucosyltransferase